MRHRARTLEAIAIFRFVKAIVLFLAGLATLQFLRGTVAVGAREWLAALPFAVEHGVVREGLQRALSLSHRRVEIVAAVAFAYAALFTVEGVGLWREKVWAEYLTIIATASLIPFEIYESAKRPTAIRLGAVAANCAIVAYLAYRRWTRRRASSYQPVT